MTPTNPDLIEFEIDFDKEKLLEEANDLTGYKEFIDPKFNIPIKGWMIKTVNSGYALEISNFFKEYFNIKDGKPRFYILDSSFGLPFHIDRGTLCSFNFLLSENPDPISFRYGKVYYKNALLNTTIEHAVLPTTNKRILFKISIFDKNFDEIKNILPYKLNYHKKYKG